MTGILSEVLLFSCLASFIIGIVLAGREPAQLTERRAMSEGLVVVPARSPRRIWSAKSILTAIREPLVHFASACRHSDPFCVGEDAAPLL